MSGPRILVRAPNWIGDAVMAEPALRALAETYPAARIELLALPWVAAVFAAHPAVAAVHELDRTGAHRGLLARLRFLLGLRDRRYALGVLLPNSLAAALEMRAAGCRRLLGCRGDGRDLLLTDPVGRDANLRVGHEVFYYLKLVARIGAEVAEPLPRIPLHPEEIGRADDALREAGLVRPLVGISPGAAFGPAKMWAEESFRALCESLAARGHSLAVFGGAAERAVGDRLIAGLPAPAANFAGGTTLREFIALAGRCDGFVTNDSGPMHVAAALGVPTVAVFGSTDPLRTGPLSRRAIVVRHAFDCAPCKKRVCPRGDLRCLRAVTPGQVEAALLRLLERG